MDPRKRFLADLATTQRDRWLALGMAIFAREMHLETSNTVYRFVDGVCYTMTRKGLFGRTRGNACGMRLIGWLVEDTCGELTLSLHPRAGAAAVLWRPQAEGADAFSLTSGHVTLAKSHRDERHEQKAAFAASAMKQRRAADTGSVARIFAAPALAT
jgi:hypothetical protein